MVEPAAHKLKALRSSRGPNGHAWHHDFEMSDWVALSPGRGFISSPKVMWARTTSNHAESGWLEGDQLRILLSPGGLCIWRHAVQEILHNRVKW